MTKKKARVSKKNRQVLGKPEGNKRRRYSNEIVEYAHRRYLENIPNQVIAREIREKWDTKTTDVTVLRWSRRYNWQAEKGVVLMTSAELIEEEAYDIAEQTKQHVQTYKKLHEKAYDNLDSVIVKSGKDIAEMIDVGIKGERQVVMGLVAMQFISEVVEVLDTEINDPDDRERVVRKLRELAAKWQTRGA